MSVENSTLLFHNMKKCHTNHSMVIYLYFEKLGSCVESWEHIPEQKKNKSQWSKNKSFKSYRVLIIYNVPDSHRSVSLVLYLICVFPAMTNWQQHRVNLCMVNMVVVKNIFLFEVLWFSNAKWFAQTLN